MQLREDRTYRTRDGSRTGIRVVRATSDDGTFKWEERRFIYRYTDEGRNTFTRLGPQMDYDKDLVEETPDPPAFSYAACPVGEDGRRRAVTRDGREVVLLCDDAPGEFPVKGYDADTGAPEGRRLNGGTYRSCEQSDDFLVPLPSKRVVHVNFYEAGGGNVVAHAYATQDTADERSAVMEPRIGDRAYKIELD